MRSRFARAIPKASPARLKALSAGLCLLLVAACGHEDYTALVRNGFWGDNRVSPISSAVDTWTGCFSGTQSWITEYDKSNKATVIFSCRLTPEAADGMLGSMKSLHTIASRHVDSQLEFKSIYAKSLARATDVKNVLLKLRFPITGSRSFEADKKTPVFTAEWADGTAIPIEGISTEDMVNAMFHLPVAKDASGKAHQIDLKGRTSQATPALISEYFKQKNIEFSTTSIRMDDKNYVNLPDNNGRPTIIKYPYYKVTKENVNEAVDSLLIPNIYQCNRWYDALMRGLLASSPKLAEFEAFTSLCRLDPRMEPGYNTTTRVGYEVVSDYQYVTARRFMYQLHNNLVNEETCSPDYWRDAYDIVQEFGNKEAQSRSDREIDLWVKKCLSRTSENGYHFLRKAALFRDATPYVCSSGVIDAMLELMKTVHLSERDKAFVERKFLNIKARCPEVPVIEGLARSVESREWRSPIGATDDKSLQAAAANIDNYVSHFFCKDAAKEGGRCGKREYIELLKSDEFAAFKKLSSASQDKYSQVEELVCGELGFCSYGILSDVYFADASARPASAAMPAPKPQAAAPVAAPTAAPAAKPAPEAASDK